MNTKQNKNMKSRIELLVYGYARENCRKYVPHPIKVVCVQFYSTITNEQREWDLIMSVDKVFQPIIATKLLNDKLGEIVRYKKYRDSEQKNRIIFAITLLEKISIPGFTEKRTEPLMVQMKKQIQRSRKDKKSSMNINPCRYQITLI
eukprot:194710_1